MLKVTNPLLIHYSVLYISIWLITIFLAILYKDYVGLKSNYIDHNTRRSSDLKCKEHMYPVCERGFIL